MNERLRAYARSPVHAYLFIGPPGSTMPYCAVDLRVGGKYRYVWREEASGFEFGTVADLGWVIGYALGGVAACHPELGRRHLVHGDGGPAFGGCGGQIRLSQIGLGEIGHQHTPACARL